jgi:3-hydroxyacyl-CoA dehydrogenase/enoyl-CoA hydratase/3-hydroxybutyryl-CoA epimerase
MASTLQHPERFVGMHFFNPPNKMPLVEVVAGARTSPDALATAVELCKKMKKVSIIVKDCPGFLVNRIFAIAANEAGWMLQEGVAMQRMETLITRFGMPMGPFHLSDEVGNDIAYKVFSGFQGAYGERFRMPPICKAVYDAQLYGKKIGKGYYVYSGKSSHENPEIHALLKKIHTPPHALSDQDIVDRFIYSMINEAARCLEEQVVKNATHLDVALIYGMGFPPFRGGLLRYADSVGIQVIVDKLRSFEKVYGMRFSPAKLLVEMASGGRKFYDEAPSGNAGASPVEPRREYAVK